MAEEEAPPRQTEEEALSRSRSPGIPLLEVLDELHIPALLIDGEGRVVGTTPNIHDLKALGPCSVGKRPRHWNGAADERINGYLQAIMAGEATGTPTPVPLVIDGRRGRPLVMKAIPIRQRPLKYAPTARAVLILMDLDINPVPSPDLLRNIFDFTRAEARLASRLAAGEGLAQAARATGISIGTARQQLKAIFAKTGCRRQSELLSLLTRLTSLQQGHAPADESPGKSIPISDAK